MQKVHFELPD